MNFKLPVFFVWCSRQLVAVWREHHFCKLTLPCFTSPQLVEAQWLAVCAALSFKTACLAGREAPRGNALASRRLRCLGGMGFFNLTVLTRRGCAVGECLAGKGGAWRGGEPCAQSAGPDGIVA